MSAGIQSGGGVELRVAAHLDACGRRSGRRAPLRSQRLKAPPTGQQHACPAGERLGSRHNPVE
jgi:hypothetical protein